MLASSIKINYYYYCTYDLGIQISCSVNKSLVQHNKQYRMKVLLNSFQLNGY